MGIVRSGGEGGIRTLGTGVSPYNGLAIGSFSPPSLVLKDLQSDPMPPSRAQGLSFGSYCAPLCAPQSCCYCWLLRPLGNHAKTIAPGVAGSAKAIEVTGPHYRGIGCCRWEHQVENFFGMVRLGCKSCSGLYERLLVAQRHHGIDSGRAAGGNVTSEKGSREQRHCHRTQGDRIDGAHSIEQAV